MIGGVTRKSVLMAMAMLALAGTAAAHTPPSSVAADRDHRFESTAPDHVQPFSVFTDGFSELTRIALPPPSIADEFAEKLAVSAELTSGPRLFTLQSKSSGWGGLDRKTWWGEENKAAPFVEPATGLVYFRERWLDPSTGTWLTPDPMGYADSSNAFARLDPVNLSDPTGEIAPAVALVLAWAGTALVSTAIDVGIDYALAREGELDVNASIGTNLTVNALTGAFSRLKYLRHLRRGTRFAAEYAADVAITGTAEMLVYRQSPEYAYGSAAIGGVLGHGASYGLRHGTRWLQSRSRYDYSADFDKDLANFIGRPDYVEEVLDEDLLLVQYHDGGVSLGGGRSAKWWEPAAQANAQSTLDDVFEETALVVPDWGREMPYLLHESHEEHPLRTISDKRRPNGARQQGAYSVAVEFNFDSATLMRSGLSRRGCCRPDE